MESKALDLLKDIVMIPSYVGDGVDETRLAEFICSYLEKNTELTVEKQPVEGSRFNIIAYYDRSPELLFLSHMDTVPPKAGFGTSFDLKVSEGKLYGLGAVDMKAGLAITLDLAKKYAYSKKLAFVYTVDEEYEFKGALKLMEKYRDFRPKQIINIEPTSLKLLNGCRGVTEFTFEVHGKSSHSGSKSLGVNAIEKAAQIFDLLQKELSKYDGERGINSANLAYLNGGVLKNDGSVGYSGNVVPNYAFCCGEIRVADPQISEAWVHETLDKLSKDLEVTCEKIFIKFYMGSAYTPRPNLKEFETAMAKNGLPVEYKDINASGFFEVQIPKQVWGADMIVFGPGPANMAHRADEYVELDTVKTAQSVIETHLNSKIK